ncbi:DUF5682 family protein [Streptomyces sp. NPDC048248]|uniref:DUF5682 family protein n=1 Tax=Streptomyces sp. NPDC048248 TaxID=3365523 RepID=UPI0037235E03
MTGGREAAPERAAEKPSSGGEPVLLGVRHHGPGSARAVRAALEQCAPRAVLIEGPPEADELVPLAAQDGMRPPVALLAHVLDDPGRAAFWPLAEFSPEWVALRWALEHGVPVRFIDLPAAHSLAMAEEERPEEGERAEGHGRPGAPEGPGRPEEPAKAEAAAKDGRPGEAPGRPGAPEPDDSDPDSPADVRVDPLRVLARAAGYDDPERWWEDVVEHRGTSGPEADALAPFHALAEAMAALREVYGDGGHDRDPVREAHMRLRLRAARKEFGDDIAVVCGAWHVPALARRSTVTADRALLKGLPKAKAALTWVPWTHRRLSRRSGYGAGIASPGWYGHLFNAPDRPIERWMTKVAGLLREEDYAVSSAHVIEAVRLAEGLATVRGRPLAGLAETDDAIRAVMGDGSEAPSSLIHDRLVVGDVLGEVPEDAPAVPLERDIARIRRALRLKPEALEREMELDLRKETDAGRSRLLHRLRLLGIPWGEPIRSRGSTGTFRETWRLRWEPELSVRVAEAGIWGTTVLSAATARAASDAVGAGDLAAVTALAEQCLLAELPDALPVVMRVLSDRAALDADVGHLAQALPALVRSVRYGDVRGTDGAALREVAMGLAERVFVGLPPACAGLDADGASEMRGHLDATQRAVALLGRFEADAAPASDAAAGSATDAAAERTAERAAGSATGSIPEPATGRGSGPASGSVPGPTSGEGPGGASSPDPGPASVTAGGPASQPDRGSTVTAPAGSAPTGTAPAGPAPGGGGQGSATGAVGGTGLRARWAGVLRAVSGRDAVPGLIRGRAARLLLDEGQLGEGGAEQLMGLALSPGTPPADAAGWIEGFVGGGDGGMLLVHDERLLALVDGWLKRVPGAAFTDVLPLLRRTFAEYEAGVRRTLGELVRRGPTTGPRRPADTGEEAAAPGFGPGLDRDRAAAVLPTLRLLLGLEEPGFGEPGLGEPGTSEPGLGGAELDRHGFWPGSGGSAFGEGSWEQRGTGNDRNPDEPQPADAASTAGTGGRASTAGPTAATSTAGPTGGPTGTAHAAFGRRDNEHAGAAG